jgi:hypothetical protein
MKRLADDGAAVLAYCFNLKNKRVLVINSFVSLAVTIGRPCP